MSGNEIQRGTTDFGVTNAAVRIDLWNPPGMFFRRVPHREQEASSCSWRARFVSQARLGLKNLVGRRAMPRNSYLFFWASRGDAERLGSTAPVEGSRRGTPRTEGLDTQIALATGVLT